MRPFIALVLFAAFVSPAMFAQDGDTKIIGENIQIIGKQEYQIESFLNAVAQVQRKKFMLQGAVLKGKTVTIIAPGRLGDDEGGLVIPPEALFNVLQTMLKAHKLILVPFGEDTPTSVEFFEIVPINDAVTSSRAEDVRIFDDLKDFNDDGAGFVTLIAHLKYADANQVRAALNNFGTRNSSGILPISQGINALLIADYAFNVKRMARIIELIDRPPEMPRLETININYMDAQELAVSLSELMEARKLLAASTSGGNPAGRSTRDDAVEISVAPNINALLVQGYDQGIQLVRDLVKRLDQKVPGMDELNTGRLHIYEARNVKAEKLAQVLGDLLDVGALASIDPATGLPRPPIAQPGTTGTSNTAANDGPVFVTDRNTNSLIVIARPGDYAQLLKILQKIDVRRTQVYVEAAILEVREQDSLSFGVEVATVDGAQEGSIRANAATSFGFSSIVDSSGSPISDGGTPAGRIPLFDGAQGGLLALTAGSAFEIPLLVRFLKQQSDINVLSVPSIMTTMGEDGEQESATINVSQTFPRTTISQGTSGTIAGSGVDAEAGIDLTVTPEVISEDGYITLRIELEASNFLGAPVSEGLSPPEAIRLINTTISVPNGNTVAVGGLTSTDSAINVNKVPFLGDIPILGELFKATNRDINKSNLYVFIRPEIYDDPTFDDVRKATAKQIDKIENELERSPDSQEWFKKVREGNESRRPQKAGEIERGLGLPPLPGHDD